MNNRLEGNLQHTGKELRQTTSLYRASVTVLHTSILGTVTAAMFLCLSFCTLFFCLSSADGGGCTGSITLYQGQQITEYTEGNDDLKKNMKVDRAVLDSCGDCFKLYEDRNGQGKSYFVDKSGEHIITLRRVRSLHKVPCGNTGPFGMPMWLAITLLVIIAMVVGTGLLYFAMIFC